MNYFSRLLARAFANKIAWVIVSAVLALGMSQCAHAETIPIPTLTYYQYAGHKYYNAGAACDAFWAAQGDSIIASYPDAHLLSPVGGSCKYYRTSASTGSYTVGPNSGPLCPEGYLTDPGGTTCTTIPPPTCGEHEHLSEGECVADPPPTCGAHQHAEDYECVPDDHPTCEEHEHEVDYECIADPPPTCDAGDKLDSTGYACESDCDSPTRNLEGAPYGGSGNMPSQITVDGCTYNLTSGTTACKDGVCHFEAQVGANVGPTSGSVPSGSPSPPETRTPEDNCTANGQGSVSSGGITVCVAAGTPGSGAVTHTDNTGGSTSEITEENGQVTHGEDPPVTKDRFCEENPNATICTKGIVGGGGTCDSPPSCVGDAIQCAALYQTWEARCALYKESKTPGSPSAFAQGLLNGSPDGVINPLKDSEKTIKSIGDFDTTDALAGEGTCPDPIVITTPIWEGEIPLTPLCNLAAMISYLLIFSSSLVGFRIVMGGA